MMTTFQNKSSLYSFFIIKPNGYLLYTGYSNINHLFMLYHVFWCLAIFSIFFRTTGIDSFITDYQRFKRIFIETNIDLRFKFFICTAHNWTEMAVNHILFFPSFFLVFLMRVTKRRHFRVTREFVYLFIKK